MEEIKNIVLIGAGNVATQLGSVLIDSGLQIEQVYSRTKNSAKLLGSLLSADYTDRTEEIRKKADLYIMAVSDDAIGDLAKSLRIGNRLIVHTSGSAPISMLETVSSHAGVFYPLQTFSKSRKVQFGSIPICIEANSEQDLLKLKSLAGTISEKVYEVSSERRKVLHLAAVFACNFTNYLYSIAGNIVEDAGFDFDILRPLIQETAAKVMETAPLNAQTGPAKRNDQSVMLNHLKMLEENESYELLYEFISNEIMKMSD